MHDGCAFVSTNPEDAANSGAISAIVRSRLPRIRLAVEVSTFRAKTVFSKTDSFWVARNLPPTQRRTLK
jgi:hypothetical protein